MLPYCWTTQQTSLERKTQGLMPILREDMK
ncbi:hypothetical protein TIFTF001_055594 [Ficus carica]|uniref:Uncharacterized protein n=1 Tax=Ficus carica TaxID=3494 RepID=A0AA88ECE1_FICCA|nr:hypothetical protein TIFTF001_055594 [Ficus carica]